MVFGLTLGLKSTLTLFLCSNFILLHVAVQFPHHLLKRLSLSHCIFLPPLSKIRYPQVCGFISRFSILFHWSIFLFLHQYHILMTVALQYSLKSGNLIPPAPFFFLKIALFIWGLLCFHINLGLFVLVLEKCVRYFDKGCIGSVNYFGQFEHF